MYHRSIFYANNVGVKIYKIYILCLLICLYGTSKYLELSELQHLAV
jgi:hypothetical protein